MPDLVVSPILRMIRDRLRVNYVDPSLYSDDDVLAMLNDAYREACEQGLILRQLTEVTTIDNQAEYDLPADFSQLIFVVCGGRQLDPVPLEKALIDRIQDGVAMGYYLYGSKLGVIPTPNANLTSTLLVLYAALPTPLATIDDDLDPRFPVEYADLLLHWVRWRVQMQSGGAERIPSANLDRAMFDARVKELRRSVDGLQSASGGQLMHASERRVTASNA